MEPSTFQLQRGDDETIECWDEDGELQCNEDIQFRTVSRATSVTNSSIRRSGHRDSISSRRSARSDLDSNVGGDEDWEVDLHENDELVNEEAFASAKSAGIPLPANVPKSALVGGAIKRLGGKKPKRDFLDDWAEDLELPKPGDALELKSPQELDFPESLRQVSSTAASPVKSSSPQPIDDSSSRLQSTLAKLSEFSDEPEGEGLEDIPTIKVPKPRSPQKTTPASDPTHHRSEPEVENLDHDFELPADNFPLQLLPRKVIRRTPSPTPEDLDLDWCEGSIGVRFGGTTRDRPSNPSSSISVVSPSVSSCLSGGSDDEGLDGLVLPEGPLSLDTALKRRQGSEPEDIIGHSGKAKPSQESDTLDDFFSGIEIDGGNAFTGKKLSLNPNVKCKTERPASPARRSATTLTFTHSTGSPKTRIPRPSGHVHSHSTHLETVSESGTTPSKFHAVGDHSRNSSINSSSTSLPRSGSTSIPARLTLSQRQIESRPAQGLNDGRLDHGTKHLLKSKRSMPAIRNSLQTPTELSQCSPSYSERPGRPLAIPALRSLAPVDRIGNGARPLNRRPPAPFIPAGAPGNQSHHATSKSYRNPRRKSSESSGDIFNWQCPRPQVSRLNRNGPFGANPGETSPEGMVNSAKNSFTRPPRRRNFGDGTELELFDDLPTSSTTESRFVKNPAGRGAPKSLRSRLSVSQNSQPPGGAQGQPETPIHTYKRPNSTPRFARDTNASRNAREQRIATMTTGLKGRQSNPLMPLHTNWKAQPASRSPPSPTLTRKRKAKPSALPPNKPQLIKPMGPGVHEGKCKLLPLQSVR